MTMFQNRRAFLGGAGAGGLVLAAGRPALAEANFRTSPFTLGVAAGDPAANGFVIWTRLAPEPLLPGGGMPAAPVAVHWQVAADERFSLIVREGRATARPELGHAVHVEVEGLSPSRPYFYRFRVKDHESLAGRARTAPQASDDVQELRFAVAGCQHYENGLFTAHRHLADENLDFVFCYGDYIYEGGETNAATNISWDGEFEKPRSHLGREIYSLDEYRRRYALYKMDPDLQAAHAAAAWFVVWDDHEFDNNWVSAYDQDGVPPDVFALRKQAAMQAFYEHMPLRRSAFPAGSAMQLYRRAEWGTLANLNFLDTRQYRSDQPCDDVWNATCPAVDAQQAELLGKAQEAWLYQSLDRTPARWKVLAQQVMMMDLDRDPGPALGYNLDSWAGYRTPRNRLLRRVRDHGIGDLVVLTGDEHQNFAGEIHLDGQHMDDPPIATEFVATSIASGGDGTDQTVDGRGVQDANPQLKFNNSQRGYVVCDVTAKRWQAEFRVVDKVSIPGGLLSTRKKLAVEAGDARIHAA